MVEIVVAAAEHDIAVDHQQMAEIGGVIHFDFLIRGLLLMQPLIDAQG